MKVKFAPDGEEHEIEFNETILHLAKRKDIHIQSVCKGIPSCAECKIRIVEGEHHVLPPSSKEIALIGTAHYVDMSRLACQLRCFGDVTVDLSEQEEKQKRLGNKAKERGRKDGQDSRAVLGNIVEEAADFDDDFDTGSDDSRKNQKQRPRKKLDNKDAFYGSFMGGEDKSSGSGRRRSKNKKKKKSGARRQGGGGAKSTQGKGGGAPQEASGEGGQKKRSSSKRRRRRPNKPKSNAPSS